MFNVDAIRNDFPILDLEIDGKPLVYLDNGATTQVPTCVTQHIVEHYGEFNGNVHRGSHYLSNTSTKHLEQARERVARFIGAPSKDNIVFTRGTTEAINTVAMGMRHYVKASDSIVVTSLEHHSNFVPWQQLCKKTGTAFKVASFTESGDLDMGQLSQLLGEHPKLLAVTCCSNVLGTVTPIKQVVEMAHAAGTLVLLDGAQAMRHVLFDVTELDCDYLAFSGHKMMAGTGIGALYGKTAALELLEPCQFGGEMVETVTTAESTFAELPLRFEAGTPNYVGSVALATAMDYLEAVGRADIARYEDELVAYAVSALSTLEHVNILGDPAHRSGCVSFTVDGVYHHDLCALVDKEGIALRSGNNCARPAMELLGLTGVARLSPAFYNTREEIDTACATLERGIAMLRAAQ